jgi:hypothetical protein
MYIYDFVYQKRNGIHFAFDEIDSTQIMYQKENSKLKINKNKNVYAHSGII